MPDRAVNFFAVFNMHLEKNYCSDIKFYPHPSISNTITRCPANFINLSAIVEELRLSEHGTKLRRDLQIEINMVTPDGFKIPPKKNTGNIAGKFCTAWFNTLMHIF